MHVVKGSSIIATTKQESRHVATPSSGPEDKLWKTWRTSGVFLLELPRQTYNRIMIAPKGKTSKIKHFLWTLSSKCLQIINFKCNSFVFQRDNCEQRLIIQAYALSDMSLILWQQFLLERGGASQKARSHIFRLNGPWCMKGVRPMTVT